MYNNKYYKTYSDIFNDILLLLRQKQLKINFQFTNAHEHVLITFLSIFFLYSIYRWQRQNLCLLLQNNYR